MELIDLIIRNQMIFFGILAAITIGFIYYVHERLFNVRLPIKYLKYITPLESREVKLDNNFSVEIEPPLINADVNDGKFSINDLRNSNTRRVILVGIAIIITIVFALIGIFDPIPKTIALTLPPPQRDVQENNDLLVFVHGWGGDPQSTWQNFPRLVLDDKHFNSFNIMTINYPTTFIQRNLNVKEMGYWINDRFESEHFYDRYKNIWIVSHSMGGLVVRELVIAHRLSGGNNPFKLLIEIATPHEGANTALLASALGISQGFTEDISPESYFLKSLRDDWNMLQPRPTTLCLTSPQDFVVTGDSAIAYCDKFLLYPQWGHIDMIKPTSIQDERYASPMSKVKAD
ncbi:alpha/beta hydrolase [Pseudomonas reactans]|nr:alpha/beta hydrolase [Pseudomonas reactans]